jgi:uncharacterized protein (DUF1778 family)
LRTTKEIKTLIKEAADYLGQTIADFVRTAAVREAKIILGKPPTLPVHVATFDKKH